MREVTPHRWVAIAVTIALAFTAATVVLAEPQAKTDETGRALGYWEAYEKALAYAPYTVRKTDETGRALGYWEAYERSLDR